MAFKERAAKAESLSDDLNFQRQTTEAVLKRDISRKAKRQTTNYKATFGSPALDQPIPLDAREFFDFCNDVLGFTLEEVPHMEICEELAKLFPDLRFPPNRPKLHGLILLPRGTFKTYICGIGLPIFILTKNPNARIMISSHRHDVAKERLGTIKKYMERDAVFRATYGNWKPDFKEEKWAEDSIVITARTQNLNDPTIDTCAVDRNKDGSHPDVVIGDDIQSVVNASTALMRKKSWDHIISMDPQLNPGGTMLLIGTRKHNQDVYGRIYKLNDELAADRELPMFTIMKRGAYNDDGSLYFPSRLDNEALKKVKRVLGDRGFANEYLNEPIEEGAKMFTKDQFAGMVAMEHFVDPFSGGGLIHVNGDQIPVNVSMVWDPAGHKPSEQSDEHGLTVVGCDPEDHWWCVAAEGIKGNPDYVVSRVAGLIMRYRPQILGVETVFRQEMWVYLLRQHLAHVGIECPSIREIESKEAKYARISALQPRVQDKGLTLDISCTRLRSQMLDYPETEDNHDDLIDSLASHIVIATPATPDDPKFFDNEEYFEESTTKGDIRAKMGCYAGGSSNSSRL